MTDTEEDGRDGTDKVVYTLTDRKVRNVFSHKIRVPSVMIDMDHTDERKYSEKNNFVRMDAPLEIFEAGRGV